MKDFRTIKLEKSGSLPNLFMQSNAPAQYAPIELFETSLVTRV
jgi:hypothetical protein